MAKGKWVVKTLDLNEVREIADKYQISVFKALLLKNRGVENFEMYLDPTLEKLHDPGLMNDAEKAVNLILDALKKKVPIVIYGDFDCDGITSTSLMYQALLRLGATVYPYFNNRFADGYNVCVNGVKEIAEKYGAPALIITVDNGISAVEAIKAARELGFAVIITDHHIPPEVLPEANAIFHPMIGRYPFQKLAGVGVAFKLIQLLYRKLGFEKESYVFLDLVALGTVADVAPLEDENWVLVKQGLKAINDSPRLPFSIIKYVASYRKEVDAYALGFIIGPMLNAEGRLEGSPIDAFQLMTTNDWNKGVVLAQKLQAINNRRKALLEDQLVIAEQLAQNKLKDKMLVLAYAKFHEGIVGLIASRLKEKYHRPILVFTKAKDGNWKGSGRSIEKFSLIDALKEKGDKLLGYGGHRVAAGFSCTRENLPLFAQEMINLANQKLSDNDLQPVIYLDGVLKPDEANVWMVEDIVSLEPYGVGFPKPKFLLTNIDASAPVFFGGGRKHVKFSNSLLQVLMWRCGAIAPRLPRRMDVVGYFQENNMTGAIDFYVEDDQWRPSNLETVGFAEKFMLK